MILLQLNILYLYILSVMSYIKIITSYYIFELKQIHNTDEYYH